jgi:glutamate-1-semialdehyde aminotransferase
MTRKRQRPDPDDDDLQRVRAWCEAQGLLLMLDEVHTGMGRLDVRCINSLPVHGGVGLKPNLQCPR